MDPKILNDIATCEIGLCKSSTEQLHLAAYEMEMLQNDNEALKFVLSKILQDLPRKREWLNPGIERLARDLIKE